MGTNTNTLAVAVQTAQFQHGPIHGIQWVIMINTFLLILELNQVVRQKSTTNLLRLQRRGENQYNRISLDQKKIFVWCALDFPLELDTSFITCHNMMNGSSRTTKSGRLSQAGLLQVCLTRTQSVSWIWDDTQLIKEPPVSYTCSPHSSGSIDGGWECWLCVIHPSLWGWECWLCVIHPSLSVEGGYDLLPSDYVSLKVVYCSQIRDKPQHRCFLNGYRHCWTCFESASSLIIK